MTGSFSSLSSALSALRYNRVAMDVASGNVANASTAGYTRRQVVGQAIAAPSTPTVWSKWDGAGAGVEASRVDRMVDPLLDSRARTEHSTSSFLSTRSNSLARLETSLAEPGTNGIAAALDKFKAAWHDVANAPGNPASRAQLLSRAETLRTTISAQAGAVATEWSDQRSRIDALTTEVNQVAGQLAELNKGLRAASVSETDAGTLLDQRDVLTLRLSELTGAAVTINADTTVDVKVGGQDLVTGNTAHAVSVSGSADLAGAGSDPLTFTVDGAPVTLVAGEIGGTQKLLTGDLPDYAAKLDAFVAEMASAVNAQHAAGMDLNGVAGGDFWSGTTAATLSVAITDPNLVAAADPAKGGLDNTNADALGNLDLGAATYRSLITTFGVTVNSAQQVSTTQDALTAQVDASREAVSGVNIDEEMVNLLAAQRGYEGAARVLTAMDSMLDTLINRTAAH